MPRRTRQASSSGLRGLEDRTSRRKRLIEHQLPLCPASGKVRFRERAQAQVALRLSLWEQTNAGRAGMTTRRRETRAYRCADCSGWHLTSWARPPRRAMSVEAKQPAVA